MEFQKGPLRYFYHLPNYDPARSDLRSRRFLRIQCVRGKICLRRNVVIVKVEIDYEGIPLNSETFPRIASSSLLILCFS